MCSLMDEVYELRCQCQFLWKSLEDELRLMQDFLTSDFSQQWFPEEEFLVGKNPTLLFKLTLWEVTSAVRESTLRDNILFKCSIPLRQLLKLR